MEQNKTLQETKMHFKKKNNIVETIAVILSIFMDMDWII